jgi:hypothetical protein
MGAIGVGFFWFAARGSKAVLGEIVTSRLFWHLVVSDVLL